MACPVIKSNDSSTSVATVLKRSKNSVSIVPDGTQKRVRFKCTSRLRLW